MYDIIFTYLNNYYLIDTVYIWDMQLDSYIAAHKLVDDLSCIFGITNHQAKYFLKNWIKSTNDDYLFNSNWTERIENKEKDYDVLFSDIRKHCVPIRI